jgi:glycosyltransferase involved in cell wall biosynthesis
MTPVCPTVSIALCTYNGAAFLPQQWQSLLDQRQLPDEIVVCDDASADETPALLTRLAATAPFRVDLVHNSVRLGFNQNFAQALTRCTGDLVFICDQDDQWLPEKISTMVAFMVQNPDVQMAFNDAYVSDAGLSVRQQRFWETVHFTETVQSRWQTGEALEVMLDGNRVMGCATVLRRPFLAKLLPLPDHVPGYIYDGWLALVAAANGQLAFVDAPLQLYRIHTHQQIGIRPDESPRIPITLRDRLTRDRDLKLKPLRQQYEQLLTLTQLLTDRTPPDAPGLSQLHRRMAYYQMRSSLPPARQRRFWPVLRGILAGDYHRYIKQSANQFAPYVAALGDLLE